ncbi:unnamed protein product [Dimorphilus gyrociliatus]|uniref:Uncharacterized protein n=1 Tax=Dimorphilus gyrociliatus TaxID=2664684 RepID=A0A7I8W7L9_9ANNE|nr:unnamed protein product [Dimorphilus gyrociliatus]
MRVNQWSRLTEEIDDYEREALEKEEKENKEETEPSKLEQIINNPIVSKILFFIATGYMVFSLVTDWLLVRDVLRARQGLVFGPPSQALRIAFVGIISVGTLLSILDFINLVRLVFFYNGEEETKKGVISEDLAQGITSLIYEVPAITLALILSMCRDEPFSIFQTIKAVIALLGSFLHAVSVAIHYLQKHDKGFRAYVERVILSLSSLYIFAASLTLFIFTYTPKNPTILTSTISRSNTIDSGRYLYKAGIFFSHPSFTLCSITSELNWLQAAYIYNLTDKNNNNNPSHFTYSFNLSEEAYAFSEGSANKKPQCYNVKFMSTCSINEVQVTNCFNAQRTMNTISFTFFHEKKSVTLPYGDIRFNGLKYNITNPNCDPVSNINNSSLFTENDINIGSLLYLRTTNETQSIKIFDEQNSEATFYKLHDSVRSVQRTWKTGYFKCPMTGSLLPNLDKDLEVKYKNCF